MPQSSHQHTSLDFINRPNPVEPSSFNHAGSDSGTHQLDGRPNNELLRVIRDSESQSNPRTIRGGYDGNLQETSTFNETSDSAGPIFQLDTGTGQHDVRLDQPHLTLPLPAKHRSKRQRPTVPPVLQGLHQPPPNAGLLPSIDAEKTSLARKTPTPRRSVGSLPQTPLSAKRLQEASPLSGPQTPSIDSEARRRSLISRSPSPTLEDPPGRRESASTETGDKSGKRPARRNKWTDQETLALLQGARKFGIGNWKKILTCPDYCHLFNHRTATDLKDRFRVVQSSKEMTMHFKVYEAFMSNLPDASAEGHRASIANGKLAESTSEASTPGSALVLPKANRRRRTKWSEEEDSALLRGFARYGPSWTSIQTDPVLKSRTPTDIRDRIRTRFKEDYAKAGLVPKPSKPRTPMRSQPNNVDKSDTVTPSGSRSPTASARTSISGPGGTSVVPQPASSASAHAKITAGPSTSASTWAQAGSSSLPQVLTADKSNPHSLPSLPSILDLSERSHLNWEATETSHSEQAAGDASAPTGRQ